MEQLNRKINKRNPLIVMCWLGLLSGNFSPSTGNSKTFGCDVSLGVIKETMICHSLHSTETVKTLVA